MYIYVCIYKYIHTHRHRHTDTDTHTHRHTHTHTPKCLTWAGLGVTPRQLGGVSWTWPTTVARGWTVTETDTGPLSSPAGCRALSPRLPWTPVTINCKHLAQKRRINTQFVGWKKTRCYLSLYKVIFFCLGPCYSPYTCGELNVKCLKG